MTPWAKGQVMRALFEVGAWLMEKGRQKFAPAAMGGEDWRRVEAEVAGSALMERESW